MEITGRLTADATVATTKNDRQVVNFSIAVNDSYRHKDSGEVREITTYINCAYWVSAKVAAWLKKGLLVQLYGRIGLNVYNNMEGKAMGSLTFHVNNIKVLAFPKKNEQQHNAASIPAPDAGSANAPIDDLPF